MGKSGSSDSPPLGIPELITGGIEAGAAEVFKVTGDTETGACEAFGVGSGAADSPPLGMITRGIEVGTNVAFVVGCREGALLGIAGPCDSWKDGAPDSAIVG